MRLVYTVIFASAFAVALVLLSGQALAAEVAIKDFKFQPAEITIRAGESITWMNGDSAVHDVKFQDFASPDLKKGEQFTKTFDKPGTYAYICEIHPTMRGTVIVV
jgi:plastocyanin